MIRDTARQHAPELERLVAQYQGAVLRTCYLYLCDRSQAEDAVQETFLKVYRNLDRFRGESSEKTWILKIAMRTCYDMNHSGWSRFFNRRVTPEMLPEASVPFTERDDALTQAVMRLPEKLRRVIILYYYQGLSVREIAETLGITQPSVSNRMKRGREKLKAALEGREIDE
jgi:RNA polymerase sigma-70 factor (ECF subfamily)